MIAHFKSMLVVVAILLAGLAMASFKRSFTGATLNYAVPHDRSIMTERPDIPDERP